jgi:hypothetical protein
MRPIRLADDRVPAPTSLEENIPLIVALASETLNGLLRACLPEYFRDVTTQASLVLEKRPMNHRGFALAVYKVYVSTPINPLN